MMTKNPSKCAGDSCGLGVCRRADAERVRRSPDISGDAVEHAKAAVSHGKEGHADVCVEHAQTALDHAKGANSEEPAFG